MKLFPKKSDLASPVEVAVKEITKPKSSVEIIDEIHSKFDTASERVLEEAKQIIAKGENEKFDKLEKLSQLGFSNSKEVKEAKVEFEKLKLAREKAKWIEYYRQHYPMHKYILVEDVRKICEEYHLLLGSDRDYIDSIPEKNMNEIINFKLREEDFIYYMGTVRATEGDFVRGGSGVIDWVEIDRATYVNKTSDGKYKELGVGKSQQHFICNNDYFAIAATPNMFNLEGKVVEGIDIKQKIDWDDPIVLKNVKFGYLVVSLWGKEAAIQKLQNERHN